MCVCMCIGGCRVYKCVVCDAYIYSCVWYIHVLYVCDSCVYDVCGIYACCVYMYAMCKAEKNCFRCLPLLLSTLFP